MPKLNRRRYAEIISYLKSLITNPNSPSRMRLTAAIRLDDILRRNEEQAEQAELRKERREDRADRARAIAAGVPVAALPLPVSPPTPDALAAAYIRGLRAGKIEENDGEENDAETE